MSWPWRPNTWEKGLRLQVSISSMAELLREGKGPSSSEGESALRVSLRVWRRLAVALEQFSPLTLNWLLICLWSHLTTSPTPFPGLSFASYSCLPADCRSVLCLVASDAVRVVAAPELMGDLCWVALRLLISAPVWRCFRQRAQQTQHEQSKREREGKRAMRRRSLLQREDRLSPLTEVRIEMTVSACV